MHMVGESREDIIVTQSAPKWDSTPEQIKASVIGDPTSDHECDTVGRTVYLLYTVCLSVLLVVIYVDDTDLVHFSPSQETLDARVVSLLQDATTSWGQLAQATGGALKQSNSLDVFVFQICNWEGPAKSVEGVA